MKLRYDTTKYVKGKQVYRLEDMIVGKIYLIEDYWHEAWGDREATTVAVRITGSEWFSTKDGKGMYLLRFEYMDTFKYQLPVSWHSSNMWLSKDYIKKFEAVQPIFTCKGCQSHDVPKPIQTLYLHMRGTRHEQRIGGSSNYWRCKHCGTINRYLWKTGYPTPYEVRTGNWTSTSKEIWRQQRLATSF